MDSKNKKIRKIAIIAAIILSLAAFFFETFNVIPYLRDMLLLTHDENGQNKLIFVEADNANCAIIQSNGSVAIINFGGALDGGDAILKALRRHRITKVDYAFITLADDKHLGGFLVAAQTVDIDKVIIPDISTFEAGNIAIAGAVKDKILSSYNYETVCLDKSYTVGEFTISPIHYNPKYLEPKGRAVIYKITANGHSCIIGGDFHKGIMYEFMLEKTNIKSDVLLLPGFSEPSVWNYDFFKYLNVKHLVSSSAFVNDHNTQEALLFLGEAFNLYRTDVNGEITFYFEEELKVKTEK